MPLTSCVAVGKLYTVSKLYAVGYLHNFSELYIAGELCSSLVFGWCLAPAAGVGPGVRMGRHKKLNILSHR
jgi:hypothetical protein